MKIVFNGIVEKSRKGCGTCGKSRSENQFKTSKKYILSNGIERTFWVGKAEDVSEKDADLLLGLRYLTPEGVEKSVFEVVS